MHTAVGFTGMAFENIMGMGPILGGKIYEENLECSFESNHCCSRCDCRSTGSTGCIIVSSIQ